MNKTTAFRYFIFIFLIIGGVTSLALSENKPHAKIASLDELAYDVNQDKRYISTYELGGMLMKNTPDILLIDVRSADEYKKFSLSGAVNIPIDSILKEGNKGYLDQDIYRTILYSNGTSKADEAWMILKSNGYQGNYVLKGGLNSWFKEILNPQEPADISDAAVRENYLNRKGMALYFKGVSPNGLGGVVTAKPKKSGAKKPLVRRKKKEVSGGCG